MKLDYRAYETYEFIDNTEIADEFRMSVINWNDIKGRKIVFEGDCGYLIKVVGHPKKKRGDARTKIVFRNNGPVMFYGWGEVYVDLLSFDTTSFVAMNTPKTSKKFKNYNPMPDNIDYSIIFNEDARNDLDHKVSLDFLSKNILFINDGSVFLGQTVHINQKAKVYIENGNDFVFRNDQGVMSNIEIRNLGSFSTESKTITKCKFFNKGTTIIRGSNYSRECSDYVYIKDCVFKLPREKETHLDIGNVHFVGKNEIYGDGSVSINALLYIGDNLIIRNKGDVSIKCYYGITKFGQYPYYNKNMLIKNAGSATLTFEYKTKLGSERISDNVSDMKFGSIIFKNSAKTKIDANINLLSGRVIFENGGDSYMSGLYALPETPQKGVVRFRNGGDVHIENMEQANPGVLEIKNGRNIYASRNLFWDDEKHIKPGGKIFCGDNIYYSNKSFLKRYNVRVEDGFAYLYKGVSKRTKKAKYDKEDTRWKIGSTHTHPYWHPYNKEIGKGKYIATYTPKPEMFKSMIRYTDIYIVELKIAVEDLYEWPSFAAKSPEFIGFRKGTVVKEYYMNENGQLEETEDSKIYQARNRNDNENS